MDQDTKEYKNNFLAKQVMKYVFYDNAVYYVDRRGNHRLLMISISEWNPYQKIAQAIELLGKYKAIDISKRNDQYYCKVTNTDPKLPDNPECYQTMEEAICESILEFENYYEQTTK